MSGATAAITPSAVPSLFYNPTVRVGSCYKLKKESFPVVIKVLSINDKKRSYRVEVFLPLEEKNKELFYQKVSADSPWGTSDDSQWETLDKCLDNKFIKN